MYPGKPVPMQGVLVFLLKKFASDIVGRCPRTGCRV
jgi:hypothetical protein